MKPCVGGVGRVHVAERNWRAIGRRDRPQRDVRSPGHAVQEHIGFWRPRLRRVRLAFRGRREPLRRSSDRGLPDGHVAAAVGLKRHTPAIGRPDRVAVVAARLQALHVRGAGQLVGVDARRASVLDLEGDPGAVRRYARRRVPRRRELQPFDRSQSVRQDHLHGRAVGLGEGRNIDQGSGVRRAELNSARRSASGPPHVVHERLARAGHREPSCVERHRDEAAIGKVHEVSRRQIAGIGTALDERRDLG